MVYGLLGEELKQGQQYLNIRDQTIKELCPTLKSIEGFANLGTAADVKTQTETNQMTDLETKYHRDVSTYVTAQKNLMEDTKSYLETDEKGKNKQNIYVNAPAPLTNEQYQGCYYNNGDITKQKQTMTFEQCKQQAADADQNLIGFQSAPNANIGTCYTGPLDKLGSIQSNSGTGAGGQCSFSTPYPYTWSGNNVKNGYCCDINTPGQTECLNAAECDNPPCNQACSIDWTKCTNVGEGITPWLCSGTVVNGGNCKDAYSAAISSGNCGVSGRSSCPDSTGFTATENVSAGQEVTGYRSSCWFGNDKDKCVPPLYDTDPCEVAGVNVPEPWYAQPGVPNQCLAPAGQKCCNKTTLPDGKPGCNANFVNYDAEAMNSWKSTCL